MNRRVLHVIDGLDPARGGPPVVVSKLVEAQIRRGIIASIATASTGPSAPHRAKVVFSPRPHLGAAFLGVHRPSALVDVVGAADVVHLHGVWDPLLVAAAGAARRVGVPYVVAPHGMLHPWSLAQSRWKKWAALTLGVRRMLARAAAIHALNAAEAAAVGRLRLPTPVCVVPNGLTLADTEGPAGAPPRAPDERPYVLFLGRLHFKKGLDHLADAFSRLADRYPEVRLVVAGPDDGGRGPFERRAAALGLSDRVIVTGPLYGPDKWFVLAGASCFCLLSRQEGFSVAVLEALASRVPVVISETCYFPEVAEAGAGFVVPLDPGAAAAALDAVLSDRVAAKEMGAAGRRLVEAHYTWETVAGQCDELYSAALTERPAGGDA